MLGVNGWKRTGTTNETLLPDPLPYATTIPDFRHWTGDVPEPVLTRTGARDIATTKQSGAFIATRINVTDTSRCWPSARRLPLEKYNDRIDTRAVS